MATNISNFDDLFQIYGDDLILDIYKDNKNDTLRYLCFTTKLVQNIYLEYPEVLHIDATYKVNDWHYPLYNFGVVDIHGRTRSIFFAFVKNECQEILNGIFCSFVNIMKNICGTRVIFIDKDATELNAINKFLPHSRVLLCSFHVYRAMERKIRTLNTSVSSKHVTNELLKLSKKLIYADSFELFDYIVHNIQKVDSMYFTYLDKNWLHIIPMWAHFLRIKISQPLARTQITE